MFTVTYVFSQIGYYFKISYTKALISKTSQDIYKGAHRHSLTLDIKCKYTNVKNNYKKEKCFISIIKSLFSDTHQLENAYSETDFLTVNRFFRSFGG